MSAEAPNIRSQIPQYLDFVHGVQAVLAISKFRTSGREPLSSPGLTDERIEAAQEALADAWLTIMVAEQEMQFKDGEI
ncbi:MAG TPA: hypothetical protein VLF91_00125 [Candidatus Saccharimonadales bacterium]|nr:hypothetical protein [Candidatus Saccharimonadales bacterium]